MADAIAELAREVRVSIGTPGPLPQVRVKPLRGQLSVREAIDRLLAGTGYRARPVNDRAWRIEPAPAEPASATSVRPAPTSPPAAWSEPIVVTATKQPLDLASLPGALNVIAPAGLVPGDPQQSTAQIAARTDGLALTTQGAGRNRLFLRGVADSAFNGESQSTVAVVLDEARLTYAAPDPDIRLVDMERVEVLKGPQGSLYGTGALGGIYRMVTHSVDVQEASFAVSGGGIMVAHGGAGSNASLIANLPVADGVAGVRLVGYRTVEPGWVDTGARRDANTTHVSGGRVGLALVPAGDWRIDLTGLAQWISSNDSAYTYAPHHYRRSDQIAEPHDNDLTHAAARLTGRIGGIELLVATGMTWHDVGEDYDATVGAQGFSLADPRLLLDRRSYRVWDSEVRLRGELGTVRWLGGINRIDAWQSLSTRLAGTSGAVLTLDQDRRDSHDLAAFVDVAIPLTGTLTLDGGGRVFLSSIRETRATAERLITSERDKAGMTPSLAIAWRPRPTRLFYVRYGSAFRQGATEISASGSVTTLANDELASFEAGWRETLPGGARVEVGTWLSAWENVQSDSLEANGLIDTITAGDARIVGIEVQFTLPVTPRLRLEGGGNYTSATLTRNRLGLRLDDRRLPVVPDYTLRASASRDFTVGAIDASATIEARYVGPARMSFDPELDRPIGDVLETGLAIRARFRQWQAGLSVRNLLGTRANTFGFGNLLRYRTTAQYGLQRPRSAMLNISCEL